MDDVPDALVGAGHDRRRRPTRDKSLVDQVLVDIAAAQLRTDRARPVFRREIARRQVTPMAGGHGTGGNTNAPS
jgi:hypothetical protein